MPGERKLLARRRLPAATGQRRSEEGCCDHDEGRGHERESSGIEREKEGELDDADEQVAEACASPPEKHSFIIARRRSVRSPLAQGDPLPSSPG